MAILRVSWRTYREAIDVLYRENQWVLYCETLGILRQTLSDVCFPLIQLRGPQKFGQSNGKVAIELKISIDYQSTDGRTVSWFVVSRENAAEVSRFILTDGTFLHANHHLAFSIVDLTREPFFVSVFDDLHDMASVRATGLSENVTRTKLLSSMKSKRQTTRQWISFAKAWLARGDMNIEEFTTGGKDGVAKRYASAMDSFTHGWRETLAALRMIESGGLVCGESEKKGLLGLQIRFAYTTSKYCAHDTNRDAQPIQVTRASLYHFIEDVSTTVEAKDLIRIFLNMARGGLDTQDHLLVLYALVKALSLQPGYLEAQELLTQLDGSIDKSWPSTAFGAHSLFKKLLSPDHHQRSLWTLVQPSSNNFVTDTMQSLKRDVFEGVDS